MIHLIIFKNISSKGGQFRTLKVINLETAFLSSLKQSKITYIYNNFTCLKKNVCLYIGNKKKTTLGKIGTQTSYIYIYIFLFLEWNVFRTVLNSGQAPGVIIVLLQQFCFVWSKIIRTSLIRQLQQLRVVLINLDHRKQDCRNKTMIAPEA